jgi:succinyl-diaminopimelate desuccinylase
MNVIPASAYVALDIRTVPGQSHGEIVRRLEERLSKLASEDPDFDASLEVIEERPLTETPRDDPLVRSMAAAYTELTGEGATLQRRAGRDGWDLLEHVGERTHRHDGDRDREIPLHSDELVSVDKLFTTCKLYAAAAMYFCHERDAHV